MLVDGSVTFRKPTKKLLTWAASLGSSSLTWCGRSSE